MTGVQQVLNAAQILRELDNYEGNLGMSKHFTSDHLYNISYMRILHIKRQ
jgi:hypothetical protein